MSGQVATHPREIETSPVSGPFMPILQPQVIYPDSDGEPMAENDPQRRCITDTLFVLEQRYRDEPQVYVSADLLVYYVEGDPYKSVAPDVLVTFGIAKRNRRNYLLWDEGKAPDVVFEFASAGTWHADVTWKRGLYQGIGVREYFLFDPQAEHLDPLLQGHRLEGQTFVPLPSLPDSERGVRGLASQVLGLEMWAQPNGGEGMPYVLRFYDPAVAAWLPTPAQEAESRRTAEARADYEAGARRTAEARIAQLEAELEQLRSRRSP